MPNPILFMYEDDNGNEVEISIPTKYEVCGGCYGEGKHVNRAVDGNGISQSEFDEDPDFAEAYFGGQYDVTCEDCNGQRVESQPDWDRMTPEVRERYEKHIADDAAYERLCAYERRWGC